MSQEKRRGTNGTSSQMPFLGERVLMRRRGVRKSLLEEGLEVRKLDPSSPRLEGTGAIKTGYQKVKWQ